MPHEIGHIDPNVLLEGEPELLFQSFVQNLGQRNQRGFFGDRFEQVFNQFQGRLGNFLREGGDPTDDEAVPRFQNFLNQILGSTTAANRQFQSFAPQTRGSFNTRFNAPTRFLPF